MSKIGSSLALMTLFGLTSCTLVEDYQARQAARAEQLRMDALHEQTVIAHQEFRAQDGWKKKVYRNETALAELTEENTGMQISLKDQRAMLMAGDLIAIEFPIASGKRSHPTPTGSYTVLDKKRTYRSNLYGKIYDAEGAVTVSDADSRSNAVPEGGRFVGASMPYWMRLTNTGIGLHVGYVPGGRPASHGCVRMPRKVAPEIFKSVKLGAPVVIATEAPVSWQSVENHDEPAPGA